MIDALMGQYGSDVRSMCALQAIAPTFSNWHHPSATRGRAMFFAMSEPRLLPMPSPMRKTPRMSENVYVLAPNNRLRMRVQTTSAASAQKPDRRDRHIHHGSITRCPAVGTRPASPKASAARRTAQNRGLRIVSRGVLEATSRPSPADRELIATATYVAVFMSNTRSR